MSAPDSWTADTDQSRELRAQLVADLVRAGDITDERWRQVFATVPRQALVPRYYRADNYQEICGTTERDRLTWLRSVYSDETLIIQKNTHTVTSSGTMPGLVALLLRALDVHDHHRVLQIGTGTGYTAALLCERLGPGHVTTMDIDPALVQSARSRLASVGYHPTAAVGNGAHGYPPTAPYDRFLATCSLQHIPPAWLSQAAPGARIVAPIAKGLISLEVHDRGHAAGRFLPGGGYFMPLRDTVDGATNDVGPQTATAPNQPRRTTLGPRDTFYHQHLRFLLTLALPDVAVGQHGPSLDDLVISDHVGSSARLDRTDDGEFRVTETGRRCGPRSNRSTSYGRHAINPTVSGSGSPSPPNDSGSGSMRPTADTPGTCQCDRAGRLAPPDGLPDDGRFDRIAATCCVQHVRRHRSRPRSAPP